MKSFLTTLRAHGRRLLSSRLLGAAELMIDRVIIRSSASWRRSPSRGTLVLATTGAGNIGDQALLESCLYGLPQPITVLESYPDSFHIPPSVDAMVVSLPSFHLRRGLQHYRDLRSFGRHAHDHRNVVGIGADIMDGGYSSRLSSVTWNALASVATSRSTRVVSMSWNATPNRLVVAMARSAARRGVRIFSRDPVSTRRLRALGIPATSVADVVFTHPACSSGVETVKRLVVVNVSGLLSGNPKYIEEMSRLISALEAAQFEIVLLPHVIRSGNDDAAAARAVLEMIRSSSRVTAIDDLLSPTEVAHFVSQAAAVVTGRMHLSILSMAQGVPSFVVATQGKVEGLLELVGHPEWLIDPEQSFALRVADSLVETLAPRSTTLRRDLREHAVHLRLLGQQNFEELR